MSLFLRDSLCKAVSLPFNKYLSLCLFVVYPSLAFKPVYNYRPSAGLLTEVLLGLSPSPVSQREAMPRSDKRG